MKKKKNKKLSSLKAGLPPGNLEYRGEIYTTNKSLTLFLFNETEFDKIHSDNVDVVLNKVDSQKINWINLVGLHNTGLISKIGQHFNIHPLVLEDVLNTEHRPKAEETEDYLFFTLKMFKKHEGEIEYEQVSIILGKTYIITFQEKEGDVLDTIREKLSDESSKLRKHNIDYLFYRIVDSIVDSYYQILEDLGDKIEDIEDAIYLNANTQHYKMAQDLRRELIFLRKTVYPLREAIAKMTKENVSGLISDDTQRYFSDVYDHSVHIIETIETYRDLTSGLMDLYMTSVSNKMNEIMKVLTIISTIFIPITFIAGIYGMNFKYMPELNHEWGYPIALILMLAIVIVMLIFFKKRKWF
ncbi:MAG: magnesium/cobalt transporter CorA [Flavobacteriales bacterium]|nr:magnesium/cobalt transporter CorA [Flavobacteriales bacterium]